MLQQSTVSGYVSFLPTAFDLWRENSASRTVGSMVQEEDSRAGRNSHMMMPVAEAGEIPEDPAAQIIRRELTWFETPGGVDELPRTRISASRWVGHATNRYEQEAELEADCHVIGIALQPMSDVTV